LEMLACALQHPGCRAVQLLIQEKVAAEARLKSFCLSIGHYLLVFGRGCDIATLGIRACIDLALDHPLKYSLHPWRLPGSQVSLQRHFAVPKYVPTNIRQILTSHHFKLRHRSEPHHVLESIPTQPRTIYLLIY
jgi:hypothetical protein